jgi:rSAM/selenodomain-associated transferase 2
LKNFQISIVIPVLNEEAIISQCLHHIINYKSASDYIKEIIVVDGGSADKTVDQAKIDPLIKVIYSKKGRPFQLNAGAEEATGEILYFLHADSFPPKNFDQLILNAVKNGHKAGCFRMKFDTPHLWFKFISWLTIFNHKACRGGDQSQFITKKLFDEIGGFNTDYLIYEDNILIAELYKRKEFTVIPNWLISSSRRFKKKGTVKLQLLFWLIYLKKLLGEPPDKLYFFYKKHID